ncbi:hypothetical protein KKF91_21240 [Myxococcota bacterium]|nr:hypothetical protein [Myxococcota bacterium]MBU1433070.1 hypothetical protein [Myxococcota bacterium]MBU1896505.1 hypothetical protein [Myxococcota bacterium]
MKRALSLAALLVGCMPMTLSHKGNIDFKRYRAVYVQPIALTGDGVFPGNDGASQAYLIDALQRDSGFSEVVGNPNALVDVVLAVSIDVDRSIDYSDDNDDDDYNYGSEYEYEAQLRFVLRTTNGVVLAEGSESESSRDYKEAMEDVMDDVALYFLRPYRI